MEVIQVYLLIGIHRVIGLARYMHMSSSRPPKLLQLALDRLS